MYCTLSVVGGSKLRLFTGSLQILRDLLRWTVSRTEAAVQTGSGSGSGKNKWSDVGTSYKSYTSMISFLCSSSYMLEACDSGRERSSVSESTQSSLARSSRLSSVWQPRTQDQLAQLSSHILYRNRTGDWIQDEREASITISLEDL